MGELGCGNFLSDFARHLLLRTTESRQHWKKGAKKGFDHCSHVAFLEQRSISTRNNPHLRLHRHPTISQALGPQSVNFRKRSYTRDWSTTTPLTYPPTQGLIKPALVSLNKAFLNPYFWGRVGVR